MIGDSCAQNRITRGQLRVAVGATLLILVSACATLPPEQQAGLKEAQRIADATTKLYGIGRMRVFAEDRLPAAAAGGYYEHADWILIRPQILAKHDALLILVAHEPGHATLGHGPLVVQKPEERRLTQAAREIAADRRGVEILVRVLGFTERDAIDRFVAYLLEANRLRGGRAILLPPDQQHPCDRLRDFWASYALTNPSPECVVNTSPLPNKRP